MDETEFAATLHRVISPSEPIRSPELLKGRSDQLDRIRQALYARGRHIFVYGERGVGKSSLAATAATEYQSSDAYPVQVTCSEHSTFGSIVLAIVRAASGNRADTKVTKKSYGAGVGGMSARKETTETRREVTSLEDAQDAVDLLVRTLSLHSKKPVAIIDEFDRISNAGERARFAELLKALGDQGADIKLIFTGVATSIEALLSSHESAYRQLETILLDRLSYQARLDILHHATAAFGAKYDPSVAYRIADISNGFPYYVHLLAEKVLWIWFRRGGDTKITREILHEAFGDAAASVNAQLRRPYEKATHGRDEHCAWILWAAADAYDLERTIDRIYASYREIMREMTEGGIDCEDPVSRDKFMDYLQKLKGKLYGSVLSGVSGRKGLYRFSESMVRGYVRLEAAKQGVGLHDWDPDPPPQIAGTVPRPSVRKRWIDPNKFSLGYRRR